MINRKKFKDRRKNFNENNFELEYIPYEKRKTKRKTEYNSELSDTEKILILAGVIQLAIEETKLRIIKNRRKEDEEIFDNEDCRETYI